MSFSFGGTAATRSKLPATQLSTKTVLIHGMLLFYWKPYNGPVATATTRQRSKNSAVMMQQVVASCRGGRIASRSQAKRKRIRQCVAVKSICTREKTKPNVKFRCLLMKTFLDINGHFWSFLDILCRTI